MGYIESWKRIPPLKNPFSKLFFIRLFQQKTCKPTKFLNQLFCSQTSKYQQDYCVYMSCWAFPCRSGSRFLVGPTRPRMGRRPAFLSRRASRKQISLFEVAMLMFDQYESLLFSQAGSPFVRRGLAYPRASIEPPPQTSSIRGDQTPQFIALVFLHNPPSASSTWIREAFLFPAKSLPSIRFKIKR